MKKLFLVIFCLLTLSILSFANTITITGGSLNIVGGSLSTQATIPAPIFSLAPTSPASFGTVSTSATGTIAFTITNSGTANLTIGTPISFSTGTPISKISDNCTSQTIIPSSSCTITTAFTPHVASAYTDTMTVPTTELGSQNIVCNGTGTTLGGGGGSCSTQSTIDVWTVYNTGYDEEIYNTSTFGDSHVFASSGDLYSVLFRITANNHTVSSTVRCRIGTTSDLSSSYLGEATLTLASGVTGTVEVLFPVESRPTVNNSSTYYTLCSDDNTAWGERITVAYNAYTDEPQYGYNAPTTKWVTTKFTNHSYVMQIKQCN